MKFTIKREELLPALQIVNGVVERRQTLPILSNLLLSVKKDSLSLAGTDMEVELLTSIKQSFDGEAESTLPARKLLDICRALPDDAEITVSVKGDKALVTSGKSRFTLSTLPAQEYPLVDELESAVKFDVPQKIFKALLDKTAFAMAQQDVRYYLNGLLLEIDGKTLRAVATDGHRLALCDTDLSLDIKEPLQVIVPRKGVSELIRLLHDNEDKVNIQISTNHIRISWPELCFTSKLIDGKFPDYSRVIPEQGNDPIKANRELLRQSLTRASILSNEKYRGVRILLENNKLRALAHNPEQEEAEEELEVSYSGTDMEIGFNVSYLLDALAIIKTEEVIMTVSDPNSSCLILPEDQLQSKYVVMPMRL
ncbi:MAG: DNA polymerase III subunit beta [Gammaproteobacteria bacterium]|nr:DNA polymerase III subunit beta [Gammaproteobacteria bacterium]